MQTTLKSRVSEIFTKYKFSSEDVVFISGKELFLTQKDKTEIIERIERVKTELSSTLYKTIYTVGIIQFLAIVGSILAIFSFMHK